MNTENAAMSSVLPKVSRRPVAGGLCRIFQAVSSLLLIGSMFLPWAEADLPPGLTGIGSAWFLPFPILGTWFLAASVRRKGRQAYGQQIFSASLRLFIAYVLFCLSIFLVFAVTFRLFERPLAPGAGADMAIAGALGIGMLALLELLVAVSRRVGGPAPVASPGLSASKGLRLIGTVDYAIAILILVVPVGSILYGYGAPTRSGDVSAILLILMVSGAFAWAVAVSGHGIRRGEGWAAMAHVAFALIVCICNALLMLSKLDAFVGIETADVVWGVVPFWAGVVLCVLLIAARRDINWPVRLVRRGGLGGWTVRKANKCPACGMDLKPMPDRPGVEYCIYCKTAVPAKESR